MSWKQVGWVAFVTISLLLIPARNVAASDAEEGLWQQADRGAAETSELLERVYRAIHGWLDHADKKTLLLPDRLKGLVRGRWNEELVYRPHNSGADNYPYLIVGSYFTDQALFQGRMPEMLRSEIRYTCPPGSLIPFELDLETGKPGAPSFFSAAEYAKDGMVPVTELLGRTAWYYRMVDSMKEFREKAPVTTRYGRLPDRGAEVNGDVLQVLARLIPMTGDPQLREWANQIVNAYVDEILPRTNYLPGYEYDFEKRKDVGYTRLRDHGNEALVGLVLVFLVERDLGNPQAQRWQPVLEKMLDQTLASANEDGLLYNRIDNQTLKPLDEGLADNWGYVYAAIYAYYQGTGKERYRQAVRHVLQNLPKYRGYDWERGSADGYADAIEGAIYLVNREPVPEALGWIESEMKRLIAYQQPDGTIERWYGDGNWIRTVLLYTLMKTQGCYVTPWQRGVGIGAIRDGEKLYVVVKSERAWRGRLCFDYARHRRIVQLARNYARLNEWPEWFTVDHPKLYRARAGEGSREVYLGEELVRGLPLELQAGETKRVIVEPYSQAEQK